jgi:hypothetical protein
MAQTSPASWPLPHAPAALARWSTVIPRSTDALTPARQLPPPVSRGRGPIRQPRRDATGFFAVANADAWIGRLGRTGMAGSFRALDGGTYSAGRQYCALPCHICLLRITRTTWSDEVCGMDGLEMELDRVQHGLHKFEFGAPERRRYCWSARLEWVTSTT